MMQIDFTTRDGRRSQGMLIQQAAEEAGLSLETLAREIGCSRALIYQYVSGATLAQPDRIQAIAERTGKPLLYFYGGEVSPENLAERIFALQTLLNAQLGPADLPGALSTCEQLIALARQGGDVRAEATARLRQIGILLQNGDAARALQMTEVALPLFRQHQLSAHLRAAEQNRGHALLALGRVEEAEECFTAVVAHGDWTARWQGTVSLAAVAEHRGQYYHALELLDGALNLVDLAPSEQAARQLRLYVAGNLANIHLACGDHAAAAREAETAQELAVQLANRDQYLESLLTLGVCQRIAGQLPASRLTLEAAARWSRLSEDKGREALSLAELSLTCIEMGRLDDARSLGKDALQQAIATATRRAELTAQLALSMAYLRSELPQEARYHAAQAWEISSHLGQPYAQAQALVSLGEAHEARGAMEEARKAFEPAFDLAESIGARIPAVQAGLGLARLGLEVDDDALLAQARDLSAPALVWRALTLQGQQLVANAAQSESLFREAIAVLTLLRGQLALDPTGDAYLENREAWEPYLTLAALYRRHGNTTEAARVIAEAEWPPLHTQEAHV